MRVWVGKSEPERAFGTRGWPSAAARTARLRPDRHPVGPKHVADVEDQREDLPVAIAPLLVPRPLLGLDRHPVLGEYPLGEPADKRPGPVQGAANGGLG